MEGSGRVVLHECVVHGDAWGSHIVHMPHSETNRSFENMENCWEENLEEIHNVCNHLTSFNQHKACQLPTRSLGACGSSVTICQVVMPSKWRKVAIQLCTLNKEHYVSCSCMIIGLKQ